MKVVETKHLGFSNKEVPTFTAVVNYERYGKGIYKGQWIVFKAEQQGDGQ